MKDAALDITQQSGTSRDMIREVGKGLHHLMPGRLVIIPSGVAVEFLKSLDERFDQMFLSSVARALLVFPHRGAIHVNLLVDNVFAVEFMDNFNGFLHRPDVIVIRNVRIYDPRLQPLAHARLSSSLAVCVSTTSDILIRAFRKNFIVVYYGARTPNKGDTNLQEI